MSDQNLLRIRTLLYFVPNIRMVYILTPEVRTPLNILGTLSCPKGVQNREDPLYYIRMVYILTPEVDTSLLGTLSCSKGVQNTEVPLYYISIVYILTPEMRTPGLSIRDTFLSQGCPE